MIETSEAPDRPAARGESGQVAGEEPDGAAPEGAPCPARLPVRGETGRLLVLSAVFVCAACGLVYELGLIALAGMLMDDPVTQTSVVLSLMVFAMGMGSLGAKRLRDRASAAFGLIESLLALLGGGSALVLCAAYLWFGGAIPLLICFSLVIGLLIGAEMPLLMNLIQRIRAQDADHAVADLTAADYVGALLGGLAFPFLLLPLLGQMTAVMVTGVVNALAGGAVVLWLFRRDLSRRAHCALLAVNAAVIGLLLTGAALVGPLERATADAVAKQAAGEDGAAPAERPAAQGRFVSDR